jgi:hypothetical protein
MGTSTLYAVQSLSVVAIATTQISPTRGATRVNETPLAAAARQLVQLNHRYLGLAAAGGGFSDTVATRICATSDAQRLTMADCRFSLFTLDLHDTYRWLPLLKAVSTDPNPNAISPPTSPAVHSDDSMIRCDFVADVVFLLWHLAQSNPLAAKILLDAGADVATALQRVPIVRLRAISHRVAHWLAPRWPQHPLFWPSLLRHAGNPAGGGGLAATKLLGRQLLAAEALGVPFASTAVIGRIRTRRDSRGASTYTASPCGSFDTAEAS